MITFCLKPPILAGYWAHVLFACLVPGCPVLKFRVCCWLGNSTRWFWYEVLLHNPCFVSMSAMSCPSDLHTLPRSGLWRGGGLILKIERVQKMTFFWLRRFEKCFRGLAWQLELVRWPKHWPPTPIESVKRTLPPVRRHSAIRHLGNRSIVRSMLHKGTRMLKGMNLEFLLSSLFLANHNFYKPQTPQKKVFRRLWVKLRRW